MKIPYLWREPFNIRPWNFPFQAYRKRKIQMKVGALADDSPSLSL